jgi:hypothetical protein
MPNMSKGRIQTKCSPWSSRLGVGCWANDPTPKKITVMKPPDRGAGQDPHRVLAPVKKSLSTVIKFYKWFK